MHPIDPIRFYFSFRSPYAWLAAERLDDELGKLAPIELIPVYPTPGSFPNDPVAVPNKVSHIIQDVLRLAEERNFQVEFPLSDEPNWAIPHAAFLGARTLDGGAAFMLEMFRARWCRGLDLGLDEVIGDAAEKSGHSRNGILQAAHDSSLQEEAAAGFRRGIETDRIFGVPTFVFRGQLYWGQDRMRFVRSAVLKALG